MSEVPFLCQGSQLNPVPWLWLAFPGYQGSRTGSLLISRGEKNGTKLKKAEQSHLCMGGSAWLGCSSCGCA